VHRSLSCHEWQSPIAEADDQKVNAGICATLAQAIANACPKAFILVISNPVNSTVPVFAETLKKAGVYDPKR
jgi:malate dehydrogenase